MSLSVTSDSWLDICLQGHQPTDPVVVKSPDVPPPALCGLRNWNKHKHFQSNQREKNVAVLFLVSHQRAVYFQLQKSTVLRRMCHFKICGMQCLAIGTKSKRPSTVVARGQLESLPGHPHSPFHPLSSELLRTYYYVPSTAPGPGNI